MELVYSEARVRRESEDLSDRELALLARTGDMVSFESLVVRKTPAVVSGSPSGGAPASSRARARAKSGRKASIAAASRPGSVWQTS